MRANNAARMAARSEHGVRILLRVHAMTNGVGAHSMGASMGCGVPTVLTIIVAGAIGNTSRRGVGGMGPEHATCIDMELKVRQHQCSVTGTARFKRRGGTRVHKKCTKPSKFESFTIRALHGSWRSAEQRRCQSVP